MSRGPIAGIGGRAGLPGQLPARSVLKALVANLDQFNTDLRDDAEIRVVIFESADPEFFLAHGDMRLVVDADALSGVPGWPWHGALPAVPQPAAGHNRQSGRAGAAAGTSSCSAMSGHGVRTSSPERVVAASS